MQTSRKITEDRAQEAFTRAFHLLKEIGGNSRSRCAALLKKVKKEEQLKGKMQNVKKQERKKKEVGKITNERVILFMQTHP